MKADHVEWLASIAYRFEAAVPVPEQASLSESEEQLTGGPLDDRGTRDRRPRSDRGKSLGCAVGLETIRLTAPANESAVIRQLRNQPDVAASVFEQREQVVAGQPGKPGIVGVGRRACQVREVVSAWEPIETSRRSQPPRAQAIAKHAEEAVIRNAARHVEPDGHKATTVEFVDGEVRAGHGDDSPGITLDQERDEVVSHPVCTKIADQAEGCDPHGAAGVGADPQIAVRGP